ncbi:hypothetical protein L3Q82_013594, partial [Scortum barcoo]
FNMYSTDTRKDVARSPADVVMTGGESSLHIRTPRGELSVALPAGVAFEQGSCIPTPAGESSGEELHFRLRISVAQRTDEEASDSVMETLRAKETYCFCCQGCMTRLLEDRVFRRVLPLPNGNWNAIVDDWCCHPDPFANKKLLPRAEDCLLGDTFLLLARDGSCEQTLTEEVSPVGSADIQDSKKPCRRLVLVSCKSCSLQLGEAIAPETLKLYITQVVVENAAGDRKPEASLNRQVSIQDRFFIAKSLFLERAIAARLLGLSSSMSTFHFSVQTPDGKAFLLLWLLNSDSITASVPETCVRGEKSVDSTALHSPSTRATRALKLLYTACSDTSIQQRDIATSWEVNAIGHPVVLPLTVCEELLQVIDDSNSRLPASMRCMRSYEGRCYVVWVAVVAGGLDDPTPWTKTKILAIGTWNVTSLLGGGGKEPELEVERYRLEIVGLTSMHSMGSGTQLLERGAGPSAILELPRVSGRQAGVGLLIAPQLSRHVLEFTPVNERVASLHLRVGDRSLAVVCASTGLTAVQSNLAFLESLGEVFDSALSAQLGTPLFYWETSTLTSSVARQ